MTFLVSPGLLVVMVFLKPALADECNPPNSEKRGVLIICPFFWLLSVGLRGRDAPLGLNKSILFPYIGGGGGIPPCGAPPIGGGAPPGDIPGIVGACCIALPSGVAPPA